MTKQELEEYSDLKLEIKELQKELAEKEQTIVTDSVTSSAEFPFSPHQVIIKGVPDLSKERLRLHSKITKLSQKTSEIEAFIDSLPNSRQRRIVKYRALDGMTWGEVAAKMGHKYSEAGVKMQYSRILKKAK